METVISTKKFHAKSKPDDAAPHNGGPSYADVKKHCLKEGVLYEDPTFPAVDSSLFFSKKPPRPFVWKRPNEIVENPKLFIGGASRFDVTQGMLGDCWLLAAVAALTQHETLLYQVMPTDQVLGGADYCGLVRFRFWQYGRWEEVLVDDRLPTYNNKLVFLHSTENGEFWSALLEKAYAKLCGSYEALKGGRASEAMEDFTGGCVETIFTKKPPKDFFKVLTSANERQSLMCCSIDAKPNETEATLENGLVKGKAYTITGLSTCNGVNLIRVRNPWGNEREWTGAWCDESSEWKAVSAEEKHKLALCYDDDGEFWMAFEDFTSNFTQVEVCMLSPDSAGDSTGKTWEMNIYQGTWQRHVTAGGCRNYRDTFHLNPQFRVKIEDPNDDDKTTNCAMVIDLMQKGRRKQKRVGAQNLTIGFSLYKLDDDAKQYINQWLPKEFFLHHKSTARSESFVSSRSVTGRFSLASGEYVVMPSTFKPNEEGDFILRMFSEKAATASSMDTSTEIEYKPKQATAEENAAFDAKFKPFFNKVAGADGEIDAFELQRVLAAVFKKDEGSVSLECARSCVAMVDRDRSGKLDYVEFRSLWQCITSWKTEFKTYDKDQSGDMSAVELRGAMAKLGFKLSTSALSSIALRYANKNGGISVDDFLCICCRVRASFEAYLSYQGKGFSLDDYLMSAIYT